MRPLSDYVCCYMTEVFPTVLIPPPLLCVCVMGENREGRFPSGGRRQRPSPSGSSPLPVTCGVTASLCGRWCRTERGRTGTWATRMWVRFGSLVSKHVASANPRTEWTCREFMSKLSTSFSLAVWFAASPRTWACSVVFICSTADAGAAVCACILVFTTLFTTHARLQQIHSAKIPPDTLSDMHAKTSSFTDVVTCRLSAPHRSCNYSSGLAGKKETSCFPLPEQSSEAPRTPPLYPLWNICSVIALQKERCNADSNKAKREPEWKCQ